MNIKKINNLTVIIKKVRDTNIKKVLIKNKNNITLPYTISTSNDNIAGSKNINNSAKNFDRFVSTLDIGSNLSIKNTRFIRINSKNIWDNVETNNKISDNNETHMRVFNSFLYFLI